MHFEDDPPRRFSATCRYCRAIVLPDSSAFEEPELHALRVHVLECAGRVGEALGELLRYYDVHTVEERNVLP